MIGIIPSFEFVKYKYFFERSGSHGAADPKDFSAVSWVFGTIPLLSILLAASAFISDLTICNKILDIDSASYSQTANLLNFLCNDRSHSSSITYGVVSSFAGGYIFMIRSLFRAINNFDFSPSSYVGSANNIISGVILATIFAVFFETIFFSLQQVENYSKYAAALTGFVIGYFPEVVTRNIVFRSDINNIKKENISIYKSTLITPVEIIDGIDSEIRDRLADHHIRSTQNLAAANPLMLFVETPYGVYQIMDWVAQAQLCCSVGPEKIVRLWNLGIRTLFDLERAALNNKCRDNNLLYAISEVLFDESFLSRIPKTDSELLTKAVVSSIQIRLDDPHVQRLRQIYQKVGDRIGQDARRFQEGIN